MMDEQDAARRLNKIKGHASGIISEADALLAAMEGEPPPVEPGNPEPPKTQHAYLDPLWGGPIGSNGRKVVENAEWKGKEPQWADNTDYVNPKIWNHTTSDNYMIGDRIGTNVRLFNPIFENLTGFNYFMYINHGHPEERNELGLVIFGGYSKGLKAKAAWAEFKATRILIEDHVVEGSCSFNQYVRQRHGRQLVMIGGRGKATIAARGWCHYVDVPGAVGQSWSGPLPYRSEDWMKMHTGEDGPWKGKAWQGTELMYFGKGLTKALVGVPSGDQKSTYPALDNVVHPSVSPVEKKVEKNTTTGELSWRELWKRAGLL
jgi:hypothetical protein